jgi:hypothetical protein
MINYTGLKGNKNSYFPIVNPLNLFILRFKNTVIKKNGCGQVVNLPKHSSATALVMGRQSSVKQFTS